jgi:hypothetical protein
MIDKVYNDTELQKQVELATENLAQILIQQAMSKRSNQINKKIENKYGKPN